MKNVGMAGAVALVGIGLISIALSNVVTAPQAMAAPSAVVNAGPEEPQIVWYDSSDQSFQLSNGITHWFRHVLRRAWSDGTVEMRVQKYDYNQENENCLSDPPALWCDSGWIVISSPTEGLNASADINFDERVDGADMGALLAAWGEAPRSPIPASDCPLGLMQ